jgi:CRP-like cAMP-binding protein
MDPMRQYFSQMVQLTDPEWELFSGCLEMKSVKGKTTLLRAGQTENYLTFIQEGMVRFYVPGETNDITFAFAFAGSFFSAYDSFITRQPCGYSIETLSDTIIRRISHTNLQNVYRQTEAGNKIGRLAAEGLFLIKSKRELSLLKESAQERYLRLLHEQPNYIQQIPLKYIASYIGVTPQALSRIRARIS